MIHRDPMAEWIPRGYTGPAWANRRPVLVTKSGLCIGLLHEPQKPAQTQCEAFAEEIVMHRRPLSWDQAYVTALCTAERRP